LIADFSVTVTAGHKENAMSDLIFHTNPQSRGRISHWMLEELGEPYDTVWLEYGVGTKSPEYLAINPMGKVPTLQHGSAVITEGAAICAYLADAFPEKNLIPPAGSPARAAFFRWLFFAAGPLEMAVTSRSLNWQVPDGRSMMVGFGSYEDTLHALELALTPGPYICGEQFTAADVYVGANIGWGLMFGTIEKRPLFEAYVARINARPAAQRANEINAKHLAG
jgi:glutathione S-transferase